MVYYTERRKRKISKGKRCMGKIQRKQDEDFQEPFPLESHRMHLIPQQ